MTQRLLVHAIALAISIGLAAAGERDKQVNEDKAALEGGELWIYNDLDKGFAEARATKKPLLVVYRCIP